MEEPARSVWWANDTRIIILVDMIHIYVNMYDAA
jgi:Leu/Phe-tRNA-protein transferase